MDKTQWRGSHSSSPFPDNSYTFNTLAMSGSNPFRKNLGNSNASPVNPVNPANPVTISNPVSPSHSNVANLSQPQPPPLASNGYPGKSSISLELEVDDSSSDEDTNPFNPNLSASDSDDGINERDPSSASDDRPELSGSAPHPAPSSDGSSISADRNVRSVTGTRGVAPDTVRDSAQHAIRQTAESSPDLESPPSRKDKKPPPPPKSHHGRRISSTATAESSQTGRSRSTNRLSIHGFHENVTSGASHPSTVSLPAATDFFSGSTENQRGVKSTDSLQRSQSQQKRPPTPPLSRRHSQMRRSKSTQSKSSRLTMSSYDSESNDDSLPPSPGPSSRSIARKRISMPPPSSGDFDATVPLADVSVNVSPPTNSRPPSLKAGRRASYYGNTQAGSTSTGPPPPPPPRRTRDSMIRSSDSVPIAKTTENQPSPQPSNALDILADLTKLQKEVDDLRRQVQ